ncbi:hypothetical protein LSAT2_028151 [Lamellibrachia satsuma]|nr:hypothetical protein LSAT2_028151 [Lamellibrachia satsuma]
MPQPPFLVALPLAVLCGTIASVLMLVAVATDHWELVEYDEQKLRALANVDTNLSLFERENGFYKVVIGVPGDNGDNKTYESHYLRDSHGGIWRVCDHVSGK